MKTPVLESLFNKVAGLKASNFIKKRLQHSFLWNTFVGCFRRLHEFKRIFTHFSANFTSVNLTKMKFQIAVNFPCRQEISEIKLCRIYKVNIEAFGAAFLLKRECNSDVIL